MLVEQLQKLVTESRNPDTMNIDTLTTEEMLLKINDEDAKIAPAIRECVPHIAKAVDMIVERMKRGGRLLYIGAGTSGRLGIVDASECPPTYGVSDELVQGIMAGGEGAMFKAVEGAEDDAELGVADVKARQLTENDVLCGIAASGRTPYVIGAMKYAKSIGAGVLCVTMNPASEMAQIADAPVAVVVGPEAVMGSTRMKAGTAQKLVLNMLTTTAMIQMGKVYSNLMVDVQTTNEKLVERARRIVMLATEVPYERANEVLIETNNNVKLAIFMIQTELDKETAEQLLAKNDGYIAKALKEALK